MRNSRAAIVLAGALGALGGCVSSEPAPAESAPPPVEAQRSVTTTPEGALIVETTTYVATVKAIDGAERTVTLGMPDGTSKTVVAPPEAVNFDQVKVGDQVRIAMIEELAVNLRKAGTPGAGTGAAGTTTVRTAPKGEKPHIQVIRVAEVSGRVLAVEPATRKVTLRFPDGTSRAFTAGDHVDLANVKPGDDVVVTASRAVALKVSKP